MHGTSPWWTAPAATPDTAARAAAQARQRTLTKPAGSLGQLEEVAIQLASLQGRPQPRIVAPWISVFAADHGIAAAGVSAYPQEVTGQMVLNYAAGGAAICVLAREQGARLEVVDVGVKAPPIATPGVVQARVADGTANTLEGPAMTAAQCAAALAVGRAAVARAREAGADAFIAGEMGIGNTTTAAALACALLQQPARAMVGPGTGLDAAGVAHKVEVVTRVLVKHANTLARGDTLLALQTLGGLEIAAIAGAYVAAAQAGLPVIVDGYIASVAALVANQLHGDVTPWLIYGHCSAEPAHRTVLQALDGKPLLDLGLRLGEGSGAGVALAVVRLACALHNGMATFAEAGVSDRAA